VQNKNITTRELLQLVILREWSTQKSGVASAKNAEVFMDWYGADKQFKNVTTDILRNFKFYCKDKLKYKAATINRKLASVSKLITYSRGMGGFSFKWGIPMVEYETENNQRKFIFTSEIENKLLLTSTGCGYNELNDLWVCLVETGCRVSELLNLTWSSLEGEFICLKDTKNGDTRYVPIFERVESIFKKRKQLNLVSPFPYKLHVIENSWSMIRKKMNMQNEKDFVIHSFRHTYITRLLKRRVGIEVVQKVVGHRDIRMTQRYNHPTKDDLRDALKVQGSMS
jgi:integrase